MPLRPTLLSIASLMTLLLSYSACADPTCPDLPSSTLRLFSMHPKIDEYVVTLSEMDRIAAEIGMSAKERALHPLMLMTAEIDAHVAVQNRTIEVGSGDGLAYCDAPTSVAVAFGVVGRKVFLLQDAAAEPCVRHALLDHYAEHSSAFDGEVQVFIRQRREEIGRRLRELKQTAAPDPVPANSAFEADLWSIVRDMIAQFKTQMKNSQQRAGDKIDSVKQISKLRNACGGKVHEMEQKFTTPKSKNALREYIFRNIN